MVRDGLTVARPTDPTRPGHGVVGWYTCADYETRFDFGAPITGDITLHARWGHAVSFYTGQGGSHVPNEPVPNGSTATRPSTDPTKPGYDFLGWYACGDFLTPFDFDEPITAAVTVYARWESAPCDLCHVDSHCGCGLNCDCYVEGACAEGCECHVPDGDFIRIRGGTFQMGSPVNTPNSNANERPVRSVTVSSFYMSRFPVTQGEWYDVMGTNPSNFHGGHSAIVAAVANWRNLPVETVSWYDAIVFANKLSVESGLTPAYSINGSTNPSDWGPVPTSPNAAWDAVTVVPGSTSYRLPTEAQWEFAARGGIVCQGNFIFSRSNNTADVAWTGENSEGRTNEVGTLAPNALGLYDMRGNVWEWVRDRFGTYPSADETDPTGAAAGGNRVVRGGCWSLPPGHAQSAFRRDVPPVIRHENFGLRVVRP